MNRNLFSFGLFFVIAYAVLSQQPHRSKTKWSEQMSFLMFTNVKAMFSPQDQLCPTPLQQNVGWGFVEVSLQRFWE